MSTVFINRPCDPVPSDDVSITTIGNWATEAESEKEFDRQVERTGCFYVYPQVPGYPIQLRPDRSTKPSGSTGSSRPPRKLRDLGWNDGLIGVELNRTGEKIGPPFSQAVDYTWAIWELPGGIRVSLNWVFLWPTEKAHGTLASIMAQQRVGTACSTYELLTLRSGEATVLSVSTNGTAHLGHPRNGNRAGSR